MLMKIVQAGQIAEANDADLDEDEDATQVAAQAELREAVLQVGLNDLALLARSCVSLDLGAIAGQVPQGNDNVCGSYQRPGFVFDLLGSRTWTVMIMSV